MGIKSLGRAQKECARKTFEVPGASGDYATEVITFGVPGSGVPADNYAGVTVLICGTLPTAAQVELWLPKVAGDDEAAADFELDDYFHSGQVVAGVGVTISLTGYQVSYGSLTYGLAGYPGAQIRVKSGGSPGPVVVSATAF